LYRFAFNFEYKIKLLNFQPLFCNVTGCCWDGTSWWNRPVACMHGIVSEKHTYGWRQSGAVYRIRRLCSFKTRNKGV